MKGSFLIKAKEENVITEKGVKAFIMEHLLNSPFKKGCALNVDDKTVKVELEGDERQIREFMRDLERAIIAKFGNPAISFTAFEENLALEIPLLMRSSQALMVSQLQKGISVQLEILDTLKKTGDTLKNMGGTLKNMGNTLKSTGYTLKNTDSTLKSMGQSMKDLPQEIAKALK